MSTCMITLVERDAMCSAMPASAPLFISPVRVCDMTQAAATCWAYLVLPHKQSTRLDSFCYCKESNLSVTHVEKRRIGSDRVASVLSRFMVTLRLGKHCPQHPDVARSSKSQQFGSILHHCHFENESLLLTTRGQMPLRPSRDAIQYDTT